MNTNEEQTQDKKLSCAYCAVTNCNAMDKTYPSFCLTTNMDESFKEETMETYDEGDNLKVMQTAAQVEHEGYMKWCRVQEIIEFAKSMGYKKLGIATCVGLIRETRILTGILTSHGFEVYGAACKVARFRKPKLGSARNAATWE